MTYTRKDFIKTLSLGSIMAGTGLIQESQCQETESLRTGLNLGIASYSLRKYSLDQVIDMAKRLKLTSIAFKSMHMAMDSTDEEIKQIATKVRNAGLDLYGAGVIYMKSEEEVENAFRYAQAAGLRVIIGVPNHELLGLVNEKVKETHVKIAIHNHGPGDKMYPSPESIYEKVKGLDPRVGLCIDIGHTIRIGLDPVKNIERYADRLHDIHLKDVDVAAARGRSVELGRGVIDIPGVIACLKGINFQGIMALEYEKDPDDVMPGLAESVGFVRGVVASI